MSQDRNPAPQPAEKPCADTALRDLIDLSVLERLQQWFSSMTGVSVAMRDSHGNLVTTPSQRNHFCAMINNNPYGYEHCRASNASAVQRAAQEGKPVKYVCHAGLTQFAAPIMVAGKCVATLVLGDRPDKPLNLEHVTRLAREMELPLEDLQRAACELLLWSDETMQHSVHFLYDMASAIADICYQGYLLRHRVLELTGLYETAKLLNSTMDLNEMLRLIAKQVTDALGMRACSIRLLRKGGGELAIQSYYGLSKHYINKGPLIIARSPIDQAALKGEIVQIPDMSNDPRILYPREAKDEGLRSGITIGLFAKDEPIGTLHLYSGEPHKFTNDEISLLRAISNQAAVAIDNARLYRDSLAKKALDQELAIAGEIQSRLLPKRAPETPGFDIQAFSAPSHQVGGDFYDFINIDEDHLGLVIADVAGKGIPAALLMASTRAALRAQAEKGQRPNRVLQKLDSVLRRDAALEHFVTCFYGVLNLDQRILRYTNAGHNPPFRLRQGRPLFLRQGGIVLGISFDAPNYQCGHVRLDPGDILVLYTDGVTEATGHGGKNFQQRRLVEVVKRNSQRTASEIIAAIRQELNDFTGGSLLRDDQTMMVIKSL